MVHLASLMPGSKRHEASSTLEGNMYDRQMCRKGIVLTKSLTHTSNAANTDYSQSTAKKHTHTSTTKLIEWNRIACVPGPRASKAKVSPTLVSPPPLLLHALLRLLRLSLPPSLRLVSPPASRSGPCATHLFRPLCWCLLRPLLPSLLSRYHSCSCICAVPTAASVDAECHDSVH